MSRRLRPARCGRARTLLAVAVVTAALVRGRRRLRVVHV